jgi:uncharacterized RDD family membrane protein YckC
MPGGERCAIRMGTPYAVSLLGMARAVFSLALRRIAAMAVDWLIISCFAAALVPLGLLVVNRSVDLPPTAWNAVAFLLLIVPATLWLAGWEGSARAASPGKRLLRLTVVAPGRARLGWRRGLARNGLKIALPWELGHTAAFILSDPTASRSLVAVGMACAVISCLLAATCVASLFVGTGRTPYDRATRTKVSQAP